MPTLIIADDKEKSKHTVYDLQPLYLVDGHYRVLPYLMFKTTVKIDMDKLAGMRVPAPRRQEKTHQQLRGDAARRAKHMLSLLTSIEGEKKKKMTFVGLVGRVPVGYKIFHLDSILEFRPDDGAK